MFVFYTLTMTLALLPLWFVVRFFLARNSGMSTLLKWYVVAGLFCIGLIHLQGHAQQPGRTEPETVKRTATEPSTDTAQRAAAVAERQTKATAVVANRVGKEQVDAPIEGLRSDLAERIQIVNEGARPPWVVTPRRVLAGPVHSITVSSGMENVPDDCSRSLNEKLSQEVRDYITTHLIKDRRAARLPDLAWRVDEIRQKLVREPVYEDQITGMEYGPLYERHALLELDSEFRQQTRLQWSQYVKKRRVYGTGLASSGVLGLLALIFGYLKLDQVTRREHSTSLQLLAAGAILAMTASMWLLKDWLP